MDLDIPNLNAIQWGPGAGLENEHISKWMPIYKKIQAKRKAIIVYPRVDEIDYVLDNLSSEGLLIELRCSSEKEARELLYEKGW